MKSLEFNLDYEQFQLDNGLSVILLKKTGFVTKSAYIGVKFGSLDKHFIYDGTEYNMPAGIAHMMEHRMFEKDGVDEFLSLSKTVEEANAYTLHEQTVYYINTINDIFKPLTKLFDLILSNSFDEQLLKNEKNIVLAEAKNGKKSIGARCYLSAIRNLYQNSTFHDSIIGNFKDIKFINSDMLKICHKAFYKPSNMCLTICGDIDSNELKKTLDDFFKDKIFDNKEIIRLDNIKNSITNESLHVLNDNRATVPLVDIICRLDNIEYKDLFKIEALISLMYDASTRNYFDLLDKEIIDDSFEYTIYYSDKYFYIEFTTLSKNPYKTVTKLINNIESFDVNSITNEQLDIYLKCSIGNTLPYANSVTEICENVHEDYILGFDFLNVLKYTKAVTLDDIKWAYQLLKNCKKSRTLIKKK